jgi:nitric oxide reductase subunit C
MERLTTTAARNIFYGGSVFFFVVFALLVGNSYMQARVIEQKYPISAEAEHGKRIWERRACFDCHTLFGEGARFAPELGKVWL